MSANPAELPLISVALCVYNGERYLRAQLESILAQEGVRLEIVAVDDRSTDGSLALLQDYAARDARFRVFENETNLGHLRSFEKCMGLCSAPLIAPSDQDDVWAPSKLRRLCEALGDADLAYCDSAYIDGEGRPMGRSISDDMDSMHAGRDPLRYVFQNTVSGHALLVRRTIFEAARPFPELIYHDWWLAMCAAANAGVVYVDEPLVQFRRHVSAYSPLGKDKASKSTAHRPARNRKWLEELLYVSALLAATGWRGSAAAGDWNAALQSAKDGGKGPSLALCWRDRASLPPWRGGWWNALKFWLRCRRKIGRARREPAPATPLFRA